MPADPPRGVVLVISSLLCGGAERVAAGMAAYWADAGRPVTLVTLFTPDLDFYTVPESVHRIHLGLTVDRRGPRAVLGAARRLRRILRESEAPVVVSYMTRVNLLTLWAARGLRKNVVVTEHNNPFQYRMGAAVSLLRRIAYPRADALTVLTRDVDEAWAQPLMREGRTAVIPNFVYLPGPADHEPPPFELPPRFIAAAGRLVPQKGFDLLIDAFVDVHRRCLDCQLVILGDGPDRAALEQRRDAHGLAGAIHLPGMVRDVRPVFAAAECFVLSSRFEGFGNVLVEAMACGTPVVSFNCPSGPSDIIRDGIDGLLAPAGDTQALSDRICALLEDTPRRIAMARAASDRARDFSTEAVMPQWDALLAEACSRQGKTR